jgi:hypothetical protein
MLQSIAGRMPALLWSVWQMMEVHRSRQRNGCTAQSAPTMAETQGNAEKTAWRLQWFLFAAVFIAFAWFHQGGGWNQNGRFAMVRAMVEEGRFSIDSYLIYARDPDDAGALKRLPIYDAEYLQDGKTHVLIWADAKGRPVPINSKLDGTIVSVTPSIGLVEFMVGPSVRIPFVVTENTRIESSKGVMTLANVAANSVARIEFEIGNDGQLTARWIEVLDAMTPKTVTFVDLGAVGATGDVAFDKGRFHPNKAPGTSFIAVPAYFLIYWVERIFGVNPDGWRALTINAWLTSVFSVGLLSAFGVVLFYRLAMMWSKRPMASLLAALAFAFGTLYFSYATALYEHNIIAALLVAAFYFIYKAKVEPPEVDSVTGETFTKEWRWLLAAGACAGYAAITNYIIAVVVIMLGVYAFAAAKKKGNLVWFGAGLLGPFLLICAYNVICFDTPFTTNYRHQNPLFQSDAFLDVFLLPNFEILVAVLVSPFRGLFFGAPVLLLGIFGLARMFKSERLRAEAWLCCGVVGFFLVFMMSYNGWHGGWAAGPRYLIPAVPFLALPMVGAFVRFPKLSIGIAVISVFINFVTTAVDPQTPVGNGSPGTVPLRPQTGERPLAASFAYNPLTEYELPSFFYGRPTRFLEAMKRGYLEAYNQRWMTEGASYEERVRRTEQMARMIQQNIDNYKPEPFWVGSFEGPVSVNPMGIYEGWFYRLHRPPSEEFGPQSPQARGNSFNVGEFIVERSLLSLLPLLAVCGVLILLSIQTAATLQAEADKDLKKSKK